jgi:hypothetical protein
MVDPVNGRLLWHGLGSRHTQRTPECHGGRYYDIHLATETVEGVPPAVATNQGDQRGTGFSPKASVTYEPNKDLMTYALVSKGFRMGGVNFFPPLAGFPTPATYRSDSLINYEVGIRPAWFDHTLTLDTTLFFHRLEQHPVATCPSGWICLRDQRGRRA